MKKILLALVVLLTVTVTYGQNKWQQKKIDYFVEKAVKEYNLNDKQHLELAEIRTEMVMDYAVAQKAVKSGELSKEDAKVRYKAIGDKFHSGFIKITGKNYKELKPFLDETREELKKM